MHRLPCLLLCALSWAVVIFRCALTLAYATTRHIVICLSLTLSFYLGSSSHAHLSIPLPEGEPCGDMANFMSFLFLFLFFFSRACSCISSFLYISVSLIRTPSRMHKHALISAHKRSSSHGCVLTPIGFKGGSLYAAIADLRPAACEPEHHRAGRRSVRV